MTYYGVSSSRYVVNSTILAPASSYNLTDLATVKAEFNLTNVDTARDGVLNRYIAASSAQIEAYCNRHFVTETIQDQFFPQSDSPIKIVTGGVDPIQLSCWPIISITSVIENPNTTPPPVPLVAGTDYMADNKQGQLTRLDNTGYPQRWPLLPIVAQYRAGFATLPPDVVDACIQLVKWRFFSRFRDPGVRQENVVGVYEASYWLGTGIGGTDDMPAEVAAKVARYRVPVIAAA